MIKHVEIIASDKKTLRGYLSVPNNATKVVVFLHGYTGNKSEHSMHFRDLSRTLYEKNIASLRLDYRNNGESDGDFSFFRLNEAIEDSVSFQRYAQSLFKDVYLLGYSLGGAIASVSGEAFVKKIILWSPAFNLPEKLNKAYQDKFGDSAVIKKPGFPISKEMIASFTCYDFLKNIEHDNKTFFVALGEKDAVVSREMIEEFVKKYNVNNYFVLKNSDHGYDENSDFDKLVKLTVDFIKDE